MKQTASYQIVSADVACADAQGLIRQLDRYLSGQYWDYDPQQYGVVATDFEASRSGFWLAYCSGLAVGCVGVRPLDTHTAELKRMYVLPAFRCQGIGQTLLKTAEAAAIAWGYTKICLETGEAQPESIRLYTRLGFQPIPCFGKYTDPESRCYLKCLAE